MQHSYEPGFYLHKSQLECLALFLQHSFEPGNILQIAQLE